VVPNVQISQPARMETAIGVDSTRANRERTGGFPYWIYLTAVFAVCGALYADVLLDLASEWWTESEASYGMLVPPTALYIAYLRRHITLANPARQDLRGLALIAAACVVFLGGKLAAEFFLTRISVVPLLAGLTWTFWGLDRLRSLAFPFVLLGTMVPLPTIVYNVLAAPLQLFASSMATNFAQALGISIYRDGNIIQLANTSLGVEEACSGLHSLPALVVGSLLLGFLEAASVPRRILLLALSVPLAIGVNVLRVTGTAVLADYWPDVALGFYHAFSSWLVFLAGFGMLWLLGKLVFRWTWGKA
jgi:exosortase